MVAVSILPGAWLWVLKELLLNPYRWVVCHTPSRENLPLIPFWSSPHVPLHCWDETSYPHWGPPLPCWEHNLCWCHFRNSVTWHKILRYLLTIVDTFSELSLFTVIQPTMDPPLLSSFSESTSINVFPILTQTGQWIPTSFLSSIQETNVHPRLVTWSHFSRSRPDLIQWSSPHPLWPNVLASPPNTISPISNLFESLSHLNWWFSTQGLLR